MFEDYEYAEGIRTTWVVASYEGAQAKHVLGLADAGCAYIVLEVGGSKMRPAVLAASRFPLDRPIPAHLTEVRDEKRAAKFDETLLRRSNVLRTPAGHA